MTSEEPDSVAPAGRARKCLILVISCMSTFLVSLDNTSVNVALPDLDRDLHPAISGLQWAVDSYLLVLASLLIFSGSLGDRFGRRRVFQAGLTIFAAGSLLSSMAPTTGWLIGFRVLQAVGASMLNPSGMSIISNVFTSAAERSKAFAVWGGAIGLGMASGPLLGGPLVQFFGWRAVFWVNVPLALAVGCCARAFVPESKSPACRRPDLAGQVLVLITLAATVYTIIEFPRSGFASPRIQASAAIAVAAAAALIAVERRRREPLIEPRFFRSVPFSVSMVIAITNYASVGGCLFLTTLYLQEARRFSPITAGLYTLPIAIATALGAQLSGWLTRARGALIALVSAGTCIVLGAALTVHAVQTASAAPLLTGFAFFGLGFGGANTPVNTTAMAGMPRAQSGVAGAMASSSRQVGQSIGVAFLGAIVSAGAGADAGATLVNASVPAWYVLLGSGAAIAVLGVAAANRRARTTAERVIATFGEAP